MKKVVRIILAILMITCACLALAACKSDCDKGNHTWDSGVITKQPTCAEEGVRTFKCTVCDHEDAVKTETVPATGNHTPKDISVQPTCTTAGTTGQTQCTVCNAPIAAGTAVEALGHNFDESKGATVVSTVKVNCTTDGSKVVKCSRCEETKTVKTAEKLGHDYEGAKWTETADGTKHERTCMRTDCGFKDVQDHNMVKDAAQSVAPKCTENGSDYYACICGKHENRPVKMLGHDYQENNWTTGDGKHWRECRRAGCEAKIDEGEHTYDSADALRCNVCRNPKEGINFVLSYGAADNLEEKAFNTLVEAIAFATNNVEIGTPVLIEMGTIDGNTTRESTGIKIGKDKNGSDVTGLNITINFKGKNYQVSKDLVGSTGTETNGFQILKGNTVKLMNGTISVKAGTPAYVLIQNYADLTLDNIVIDGTNLAEHSKNYSSYTLSNNSGNVTLTNATHIIAGEGEKRVALDVWYNMGNWYAQGVHVTVGSKSTITGIIEYGSAQANVADLAAKAALALPELTAGEYKIRFSANITDCEATGITIGGVKFSHKEHTVEAVAPDCTNTGLTAGVDCSLCGKTIKAQQVVNALGHDFDMSIEGNCSDRVDSTCSQKGHVTVKCSRCDATEVQDLPFAEHTPTDTIEHDGTQHWYICGVCNGAANKTNHTYVASKCSVCNYAISNEDAFAALDALTGDIEYALGEGTFQMSGIVVSIDQAYNSQYKNITITIKVGNREIQCYRAVAGGSVLLDTDTIQVGQTVTVLGKLKKHYNNRQFDQGTEILAIENVEANINVDITNGITDLPTKAMNGSTVTFTVTPDANYKVDTVKAYGKVLTAAADGSYSFVMAGDVNIEITIVSNSVPTAEIVATLDFTNPAETNSGKVSSYTASWSATCNGTKWDIKNFNNNNNVWKYIRAGRKNSASVAYINTNAAMTQRITKVVVTVDAVTTSSINSVKLYVKDAAGNVIETVNGTVAKGEMEFAVTTPTANCTYELEFDCASGSSNGLIQVSKVAYWGFAE